MSTLFTQYLEKVLDADSNSTGKEAEGKFKKGDIVTLKKVQGSAEDWGFNAEQFKELKSHVGKKAKVISAKGFLVRLKFDDDFEIKDVNDNQLS